MQKKWQVAKAIDEKIKNSFAEVNPLVLQLLFNRGLRTQDAIDEFLNPDYGQDIHDPFLFSDMKKAVERIFLAIQSKEKITVHGDYDADGVCATATVVTVLKDLGADVDVYIPHRVSEGYGLNLNTVKELKKNGTKLIVTVDCGISSLEEVRLAQKQGIDVIITDHHEEPPQIPEAYAIINPHLSSSQYPFRELAGTGVAFKLAQALVLKDQGSQLKPGYEKWLLDLVALGTIADCVPLVGENRTLAKYGLVVLRKTRRIGLQQLAESSRINLANLDTSNVSFGIVPRINAAGRIDHANTAYQLLVLNDTAAAENVCQDLQKTNTERQHITEKIFEASKKQIGEVSDQKILFALGHDWPLGVVGLVAGRLSDLYARPVLVMGERADEVVGSGRSIPGFDITKALIESRTYLERFGGHATACGFTLKKTKLFAFQKKMESLASSWIKPEVMVRKFFIDAEVRLEQINWELVAALEQFEPFGEGNPTPRFVSFNVEVDDLQKVGNTGQHLRLTVSQGNSQKKVIAFGFGQTWGNELQIGDRVDIVYELSVNEWNGNRELQVKLADIKMGA